MVKEPRDGFLIEYLYSVLRIIALSNTFSVINNTLREKTFVFAVNTICK